MATAEPKERTTLKQFLESLYPAKSSDKIERNDRFFRMFHHILAQNRCNRALISALWVLFYCLVLSSPIFMYIRVPWFDSLLLGPDGTSSESDAYLRAQIILRESLLAFGISTIILIGYQYYAIFTYETKSHISDKKASFLYLSFTEIPLVLSPIYGIISGCMLVTNFHVTSFRFSTTLYQVLFLIIFLILVGNSCIFAHVTKYSLTLSSGAFGLWQFPYNFTDYFFFFLTGLVIPFRKSSYSAGTCVVMLISMVWGALILFYRRHSPVFVGVVATAAEFFVACTLLDMPIFSLVTLFTTQTMTETVMGVTCLIFMNVGLAAMYIRYGWRLTGGYAYFVDSAFVPEKVKNWRDALRAIRLGVMNGLPAVRNQAFLARVLESNFTPSLIPDIVRLSIITGMKLEEFRLPRTSFGPAESISLQFMGLQWRLYTESLKVDGDMEVEKAVKELESLIGRVRQITKDFWTENDIKHRTLMDYGLKVKGITRIFKMYLNRYPLSEKIRNVWERYATYEICEPSKANWDKADPFETITNPSKSIYRFLASEKSTETSVRMPKYLLETPTEKFIDKTTRGTAVVPRVGCVRILVAICMLFVIVSEIGVITDICRGWVQYANVASLATLGLSLTGDLVRDTEQLIDLPVFSIISQVGDISAENATLLRNRITLKQEWMEQNNFSFSLLDGYNMSIEGACPEAPLDLNTLSFRSGTTFRTLASRSCYIQTVSAAIYKIRNLSYEFTENYEASKGRRVETNNYWIMGLGCLIFIVMIGLIINGIRKWNRILSVIRNITAMNPVRNERNGPTYLMFSGLIVLLCFCLFIVSIGLVSRLEVEKSSQRFIAFHKTLLNVFDIARSIFLLHVYANFQIVDKENGERYYNKWSIPVLKLFSEKLDNFEVNPEYANIYPFSNWSQFSITMLNYAQMRSHPITNTRDYSYLKGRIIMLFESMPLISETLPELMKVKFVASSELDNAYWILIALCAVFLLVILWISELIGRKEELWYYGAGVIIRRRMISRPQETYFIKPVLEKGDFGETVDYIDQVPIAILIRRTDGTIVKANQWSTQFTCYTVDQTIGQRFEEFFIEDLDVITSRLDNQKVGKVTVEPFGDDLELVMIIPVPYDPYPDFVKRMVNPDLNELPTRGEYLYVAFKTASNGIDPTTLFHEYDKMESNCEALKRIRCSVCDYCAIADVSEAQNIISAVFGFAESIRSHKIPFSAAVTAGEVTVMSLYETEPLSLKQRTDAWPMVYGAPVARASAALTGSRRSKVGVFIDEALYDGEKLAELMKNLPDATVSSLS